jgi:RsiW-degrading membrane proteinase PrsW (M82 family)
MGLEILGYAFVGGLLPTLVWLYFLLQEDARCPEPRWIVFLAFLAGMLAVPLVLWPQSYALDHLASCSPDDVGTCVPLLTAWAMIEETAKYALAAIAILWRREAIRRSLDIVTCMITVALGFAALENMLFLIGPLSEGNYIHGFITGNLRFIGSTLLHVIASSAIGFAMAFSFEKSRPVRAAAASLGLILAIALHALFNFFILSGDGSDTVLAFFTVWTGAIVFFAAFEVLKYFRYRNLPKNVC